MPRDQPARREVAGTRFDNTSGSIAPGRAANSPRVAVCSPCALRNRDKPQRPPPPTRRGGSLNLG